MLAARHLRRANVIGSAKQMKATVRSGTSAVLIVFFSTNSHAAGNNACALLTAAEVGAIVGAPMDPGAPLTPTFPQYCSFNETGNGTRNAHISIIDEHKFALGKTAIAGVEKSAESGIGDEAYWSKAHGMVYNLSVRKGSNYFRVQSRTNKDALAKANTPALDEQDKAADRKLALEIIKKL
jgi:hypothetical protein